MGLFRKAYEFLTRPFQQQELSRQHYLFATLIFALFFSLGLEFGIFKGSMRGPQPGETDISGIWKLNLKDRPEFAHADFNDSSWCPVAVPVPREILKMDKATAQLAKSCWGREYYPRKKMLESPFWYRTQVRINSSLKDPNLFLGAIKHRATIYWDGELLANIRYDQHPMMVPLTHVQARPGQHTLAIRVETEKSTMYPGIIHMYKRGVTVGEAANDFEVRRAALFVLYVRPSLAVFMQAVALFIMLTLMMRMQGIRNEYLWLSIYFAGTALYFSRTFINFPEAQYFAISISKILISGGVIGVWIETVRMPAATKDLLTRSNMYFVLLGISLFTGLAAGGPDYTLIAQRIALGLTALVPMICLVTAAYAMAVQFPVIHQERVQKGQLIALTKAFSLTAILAGIFSSSLLTFNFLGASWIDYQIIMNVLTVFVLLLSVEDYAKKQKELAFFGRFVRPGLRNLLMGPHLHLLKDDKGFHGRKAFILKMDVVNHTLTTYQMPYGVKRLFQDMWFSTMDRVFSEHSFLDKNLGDGSIYCFADEERMGPRVLNMAFQIINEELAKFDQAFHKELQALLAREDELHAPFLNYKQIYRERFGHHFHERKTKVRIAVAYGMVDEGLWGQVEQAHYDVQGDLVTLVARLESEAGVGEIVIDEQYFTKLKADSPQSDFVFREDLVQLKGIGETKLFRVRDEKDLSDAEQAA